MIQNVTNMKQNGTQMSLWWAPDGPSGPQDGYKRLIHGHKETPRYPKETPTWLQVTPRWPQETQDGFIRIQLGPKVDPGGLQKVQMRYQDGHKMRIGRFDAFPPEGSRALGRSPPLWRDSPLGLAGCGALALKSSKVL